MSQHKNQLTIRDTKRLLNKKLESIMQRIKIKVSQREKYKSMSTEDKKKLFEKQKEWFNRETEEKQIEMKRKAREYSKNRYHNHIIVVN